MPRTLSFATIALTLVAVTTGCMDDPVAGPTADPGSPALIVVKANPSPTELLGRLIFQDRNLSVGQNQSCQSCHEFTEGGAAPLSGVPSRGSVVQGSVSGRFGDRKPPTTAYATLTPNFTGGGNPVGGLFWDGRATGATLGTPAADQALGPFLNPAEQALPDMACIAYRIRNGGYLTQYSAVHSTTISTIAFPSNAETVCITPVSTAGELVALSGPDRVKARDVYYNAARAIAAFEAAQNAFQSNLDRGQLTTQELQGQKLFSGKGKCHQCHSSKGSRALFTDFRFHNLGVPRNPANPVYNYVSNTFDRGLGGITGRSGDVGRFRTPTTRNVAQGSNRTYMHNGAFVSLLQVVDFYNSRDVTRTCNATERLDPTRYGNLVLNAFGCWPAPEYPQNMDTKQMGNLGLTRAEVDAIVAYMAAMTDLP
jgi:cytochrome c peroxidase